MHNKKNLKAHPIYKTNRKIASNDFQQFSVFDYLNTKGFVKL